MCGLHTPDTSTPWFIHIIRNWMPHDRQEDMMRPSVIFGGIAGLTIGAIVSWLSFGNAVEGVGIGISIAAAACGALIAYGHEQYQK